MTWVKVHGHSKPRSPTYISWRHMKDRCTNKASAFYKDYGARGITVCERWMTFKHFLADMGVRPEGTSLDRIDNSRGYEPGNCRWASAKDQANNRRFQEVRRKQEQRHTHGRRLSDYKPTD